MPTAHAVPASTPARHRGGAWARRARAVLDRPRLWRATAAIAAILLVGVVALAAQGSFQIVARRGAVSAPSWTRWCVAGQVRADRRRLAFCARVSGVVLAATHGPAAGESHVAVVGAFHLFVVRLPDDAAVPGVGSRITAIGPLLRARDGEREVQAFRWQPR